MISSEFTPDRIDVADNKIFSFPFNTGDGEVFNLWITLNPNSTEIDLHLHGFGSGAAKAKGLHGDERSARSDLASVAIYDNGKALGCCDSESGERIEVNFAIGYERYKKIHLAAIRRLIGMSRRETKINLLGHSMGSVATLDTLLELRPQERERIGKVVLHSMPVEQSRDRFTKVFQKPDRPKTYIDYNGLSILQRGDGSQTCMPAHIWDEMEKMDSISLVCQVLKMRIDLHLIYAEDDKVLSPDGIDMESEKRMKGKLDTLKSILGEKFHTISEGGHDFENNGRKELLAELDKIMTTNNGRKY